MARETLTLIGTAVSCAQCLTLITNGLKPLNGVESISADTHTDTLIVNYNCDAVDEEEIRATLRSLGFTRERLYCIC